MTTADFLAIAGLGILIGFGAQVAPGPMLVRSALAGTLPGVLACVVSMYWTIETSAVGSSGIALDSTTPLWLALYPAAGATLHLAVGRLVHSSSWLCRFRPFWIGTLAGLVEVALWAGARL